MRPECCRWAARRSGHSYGLGALAPGGLLPRVCASLPPTRRRSAAKFCSHYARRLRRLLFVSYVIRAVLFFSRGLLHVGRVPGTRVHAAVRGGEPLLPPRVFEFQASGTGTLATWWRRRGLRAQYSTCAVALGVCMIVLIEALYTGHWPAHLPAVLAGRSRSRPPGTPGSELGPWPSSPAPTPVLSQVPVPGEGR